MKRSVRLLLGAMKAVDLPTVVVRDVPKVTLEADANVYVENHGGICGFSDHEITVFTAMELLYIEGSGLRIEQMDRMSMRICGKIDSVGYRRKR
ncbi:MAG: sporulation protein [Ruminococcaceae bacterium]|nr:sporulation protein [Oscillospiraceae bacterium]